LELKTKKMFYTSLKSQNKHRINKKNMDYFKTLKVELQPPNFDYFDNRLIEENLSINPLIVFFFFLLSCCLVPINRNCIKHGVRKKQSWSHFALKIGYYKAVLPC